MRIRVSIRHNGNKQRLRELIEQTLEGQKINRLIVARKVAERINQDELNPVRHSDCIMT